MITNYSDTVRVRNEPVDMNSVAANVFVEKLVDGAWVVSWSTNEMSNDYAYSEAKRRAKELANPVTSVGLSYRA